MFEIWNLLNSLIPEYTRASWMLANFGEQVFLLLRNMDDLALVQKPELIPLILASQVQSHYAILKSPDVHREI